MILHLSNYLSLLIYQVNIVTSNILVHRHCDGDMLINDIALIKLSKPVNIRGGSICNENSFITPSINALGCYAISQDQSVAFIMVYETLFYLSKFNKLQTF